METQICVCEAYKTVMVGIVSRKIKAVDLYNKLSYVLGVEYNIDEKEMKKYKVKLIDVDTTMQSLKGGHWYVY